MWWGLMSSYVKKRVVYNIDAYSKPWKYKQFSNPPYDGVILHDKDTIGET